MQDYNKFVCTARVATDPEVKVSKNGKEYASFRVAYNRGYGGNEETSFVTVQAFGQKADFVSRNITKGQKVLVEGSLSILSSKGADNKYSTAVFVTLNEIQFLSPKEQKTTPYETAYAGGAVANTPKPLDFEDDIPF